LKPPSYGSFYLSTCSLKVAWKQEFETYGPCVSNPLLGGVEAEGFGVGIHDEEPTPELCASPPEWGFQIACRSRAKFRFYVQCQGQSHVTPSSPASAWVRIKQRIVPSIAIKVPALRISRILICKWLVVKGSHLIIRFCQPMSGNPDPLGSSSVKIEGIGNILEISTARDDCDAPEPCHVAVLRQTIKGKEFWSSYFMPFRLTIRENN